MHPSAFCLTLDHGTPTLAGTPTPTRIVTGPHAIPFMARPLQILGL